jgi:hypothetical protein
MSDRRDSVGSTDSATSEGTNASSTDGEGDKKRKSSMSYQDLKDLEEERKKIRFDDTCKHQ